MQRATISELKSRLSAYLKKVRAGETILILDRNQPIAKLEPVSAKDDPAGHLEELVRTGALRRATKRISTKWLRAEPPASRKSIVDTLLEERREGR